MSGFRILAVPASLIICAAIVVGCGGQDTPTPADPTQAAGLALVERNCVGCHSLDGTDRAGPTFANLAGSQVQLEDGRSLTADDAYLTRAIADPDAEIAEGYSKGIMSASVDPGEFSEEEIAQMVAYIKSVRTN